MFKLLAFWILGCGLDQSGWLILSFVMQQIGCLFGIGLFCRWLLSKAIYGVFSPGAFNCVPLQCCRSAGENVALRVFFLYVFFLSPVKYKPSRAVLVSIYVKEWLEHPPLLLSPYSQCSHFRWRLMAWKPASATHNTGKTVYQWRFEDPDSKIMQSYYGSCEIFCYVSCSWSS